MIELGTLPTGGAVAFLTTLTELTCVGVVFCMAARTFLQCTRELIVHMALVAGHFEVRAGQRKSSLRVVELSTFPASGVVAFPTALTELARMSVVFCMAARTFLQCTRELIVHMALVAGHFEVRAG